MSIFTDLVAGAEAEWEVIETVAEADAVIVWDAIKPLLETIIPSQAAVLIGVIKDNLAVLVVDPAAAMTAILSDLAAKELTWWNAFEPQLQTALINAFSSVLAIPTTTAKAGA